MFGAVMLVSAVASVKAEQQMLDARPGGIIHVPYSYALRWLLTQQPIAKDCEGCGAPLKAHLHHCEYCRREK